MPSSIKLDMPFPIPSVITLDASAIPTSIQVKGIPSTIEIKENIPREIIAKLQIPENLKIPIVYEGGPIPLDISSLKNILLQKPDDNKETQES